MLRAVDGQAGHRPDPQRALVGAAHRRAAGDDVSFADELVDVEAQVGERGAQGRDHVLEVGGEVGSVGLLVVDRAGREGVVDVGEVALVEHALEALERPCLQLLGGHPPLLRMAF